MEPLELNLDVETQARLPAELLISITRQLRYRAMIVGYSGMSFRYEGSRYVCVLSYKKAEQHLKLHVTSDSRSWFDAVRHWFQKPV